jgi:glycine/D-amino acid oxidase-like deaminating enzyme
MRIAVLGAGIQGCCLALELASRGVEVDIYDRNAELFTQASLLNEAKIHLGFFYANEPTMRTTNLVMRGALSFLPILRSLLGNEVDSLPASKPYVYAVHADSMLSVAQIEAHLQRTSALITEAAPLAGDYFGVDLSQPVRPVRDVDACFNRDRVVAAFQTPEVGISADALARLMRRRLAGEANVRCITSATVTAAVPGDADVEVRFELAGDCHAERYDHAINALWDGRLTVDATAGVRYEHPWLFRTKYSLHIPAGATTTPIPSVSFVLGAFGDIVQYAGGESYLSWYPAGLKASTSGLAPDPFAPLLEGEAAGEIRRGTIEGLSALLPELSNIAPLLQESAVQGGVIFAWGETDITDPLSELHSRHEVGPRSYGRYHSVDTGKFTTAPLFARQLVTSILEA